MIKKKFAIHICEGEPEIPSSVTAAPCHLNKDTKPQPSEADAVLRSRAAEQAISAACGGMSDAKLARTRGGRLSDGRLIATTGAEEKTAFAKGGGAI